MKCNIICKFASRTNTYMKKIDARNIDTLDGLAGGCRTVTLVAHIHPDGDAIGSTQALRAYLEARGADAVVIYPEAVPETLAFMVKDVDADRIMDGSKSPEEARKRIMSSDLIFCVDCNSFSRTGDMEKTLREAPAKKVLIDHHLAPDVEAFDLVFSDADVSSACELMYYVLLEMPDIKGDASRIPALAAALLMTGMTTDTNNFANSVFPSTLAMVSGLLAAGVNRDQILQDLYNSYRENRLRMEGYLLHENMKITPEGVAYMIVDKKLASEFDIREGETEGFVNMPLAIGKVGMSIFLKEDGEGFFRVSVRSKKGISANKCAIRYFHGGGHERASGGRLFFSRTDGVPADINAPGEAESYIVRSVAEFFKSGEYES